MRQINLLVIHCSATKENQVFTVQALEVSHRKRGFNGIGICYEGGLDMDGKLNARASYA